MKMHLLLAALALAACDGPDQPANVAALASAPAGNAAAPTLALAGRVTDAADILPPAAEAALTQQLTAFEQRTRHQMVVVTVPSLEGRDVADYTRALANRWGIGRREEDDGVVLLVAPNERKARIEVGRGLETTLTNELCAEIMNARMIPRFSDGDYTGGIDAGVEALIARLESAVAR